MHLRLAVGIIPESYLACPAPGPGPAGSSEPGHTGDPEESLSSTVTGHHSIGPARAGNNGACLTTNISNL